MSRPTSPPPPAPVRPFTFPPFERIELHRGLTLYAAPQRRTPLVHLEAVVPAGARFDPEGGSGLAALTAGLLDEGTRRRSAIEIASAAERIGGYLSTGTDWDVSTLSSTLVSDHLVTGLGLLSEVLATPTFPAAEVERLRARTLAEIRRRRVFPASRAALAFSSSAYPGSVYAGSVIGSERSVGALDRSAVETFYRDCLCAAPMSLIVVGDHDTERLAAEARRAFAGIPRRSPRTAPALEPQPLDGTRVVLVDRPGAPQTELRVGHAGIPRGHPDFLAAAVLATLLGGKFTSRLNLRLREELGITYGIRSSFARRLGPGPFLVSAAVDTDSTGEAVREIVRQLRRLREEPPADDELEETKSFLLGVFPYTVESLGGVASRLQEVAVHSLPTDYWDGYAERLRQVTAEDVLRAARRHLRPDALTIVAVGPRAPLAARLEPFGELSEDPELEA